MTTVSKTTKTSSAALPQHLFKLTLAAAALASLAACGGGGDSPTPAPTPAPVAPAPTPAPVAPAPAPAPVAVSGKVIINQGIKNAKVCMDLNANSLCDTGEPASAAVTGADGAYTLSYDPSVVTAAQVAAAPMLALIGTDAVDAATPTVAMTKALVLSAPAGKGTQINPLTTLVQTGVASGLTLAKAEAAVALQLTVPVADIYDYQANASDAIKFIDNARYMARLTASALTDGATLSVIDVAATTADSDQLAYFNWTDANNYFVDNFHLANVVGTGTSQITDQRSGLTAGFPTTLTSLYGAQAYLTPTGWKTCASTSNPTFMVTQGTPNRSGYCAGGFPQVGYSVSTDISGKPMADVVRAMQAAADGSNSINMNATLLGTQTFPTGSALFRRQTVGTNQPIYINNLNSAYDVANYAGFNNLESYIANRRSQTLDVTNSSGMAFAGFTVDTSHWLFASFVDAISKVQYYSCTFNTAQTQVTGCTVSTAGTFAVQTVNGVRVLVFAGQPDPVASVKYTFGYAEYNGAVARYRQTKPELANNVSVSQRLNGVAATALKKVMGL